MLLLRAVLWDQVARLFVEAGAKRRRVCRGGGRPHRCDIGVGCPPLRACPRDSVSAERAAHRGQRLAGGQQVDPARGRARSGPGTSASASTSASTSTSTAKLGLWRSSSRGLGLGRRRGRRRRCRRQCLLLEYATCVPGGTQQKLCGPSNERFNDSCTPSKCLRIPAGCTTPCSRPTYSSVCVHGSSIRNTSSSPASSSPRYSRGRSPPRFPARNCGTCTDG